MFNFNYYNPTHIIFGKDRLNSLDQMIPQNAKVLITFGGGSAKKSGLIDKIKDILKTREVLEFSGIEPNPRYETLMKAAEIVKKENITFLLAVGGGSVIDGSKFIKLAANYKGEGTDLLKFGFMPVPLDVVGETIPMGTILTLPATGSEMNAGAVISYNHGKYPVSSSLSFPKFSILDPTITYTLPKKQVANGIVDTFVHTTEQYLTFPVNGMIQDRFSEGILQTLLEIGKKSVEETENYEIRANHVWASTLALNTLIGAGVPQDWATHMIGHELTAMFGIDHGQSLAIVLPALLEVRKDKKRAKLIQYAERVWNIDEKAEDKKIDLAISKTREFFEDLGVKTHLSDYGVKKEDIQKVVDQLEAHGWTKLSETQDLTLDISKKILERAF
jgi:NADP-dependent alcohol dehydrogenase